MSSPMEKKWKDKSRNKNKENDGELCKRAHSQIQPVREAGIQTAAQAYLQTTRPSHSKATALPSFASRRCAWLNSDLMTLTVRAARSRGPQQTWHRASQGPQPRDRQTRPETFCLGRLSSARGAHVGHSPSSRLGSASFQGRASGRGLRPSSSTSGAGLTSTGIAA